MRLIPERRILAYVGAMMGGVAIATIHRDLMASPAIIIAAIIVFMVTATAGLRLGGDDGMERGNEGPLLGCLVEVGVRPILGNDPKVRSLAFWQGQPGHVAALVHPPRWQ